jgi:hypothetical protein
VTPRSARAGPFSRVEALQRRFAAEDARWLREAAAESLMQRQKDVHNMLLHKYFYRATSQALLLTAYTLLHNMLGPPTDGERLAVREVIKSILQSPVNYALDKKVNMRIVELLMDHYQIWPKK